MPATRLARLEARRAARARRARRATTAIGLTLSTTILLVAMLGVPGALAREAEDTLVPDAGLPPVDEPASIAGTAPVDPVTDPVTEPEPTAATGEAEKVLEADQPPAPAPTPVAEPEPRDGEEDGKGPGTCPRLDQCERREIDQAGLVPEPTVTPDEDEPGDEGEQVVATTTATPAPVPQPPAPASNPATGGTWTPPAAPPAAPPLTPVVAPVVAPVVIATPTPTAAPALAPVDEAPVALADAGGGGGSGFDAGETVVPPAEGGALDHAAGFAKGFSEGAQPYVEASAPPGSPVPALILDPQESQALGEWADRTGQDPAAGLAEARDWAAQGASHALGFEDWQAAGGQWGEAIGHARDGRALAALDTAVDAYGSSMDAAAETLLPAPAASIYQAERQWAARTLFDDWNGGWTEARDFVVGGARDAVAAEQWENGEYGEAVARIGLGDEVVDDWEQGRPGEAIGRVVPDAAMQLLGGWAARGTRVIPVVEGEVIENVALARGPVRAPDPVTILDADELGLVTRPGHQLPGARPLLADDAVVLDDAGHAIPAGDVAGEPRWLRASNEVPDGPVDAGVAPVADDAVTALAPNDQRLRERQIMSWAKGYSGTVADDGRFVEIHGPADPIVENVEGFWRAHGGDDWMRDRGQRSVFMHGDDDLSSFHMKLPDGTGIRMSPEAVGQWVDGAWGRGASPDDVVRLFSCNGATLNPNVTCRIAEEIDAAVASEVRGVAGGPIGPAVHEAAGRAMAGALSATADEIMMGGGYGYQAAQALWPESAWDQLADLRKRSINGTTTPGQEARLADLRRIKTAMFDDGADTFTRTIDEGVRQAVATSFGGDLEPAVRAVVTTTLRDVAGVTDQAVIDRVTEAVHVPAARRLAGAINDQTIPRLQAAARAGVAEGLGDRVGPRTRTVAQDAAAAAIPAIVAEAFQDTVATRFARATHRPVIAARDTVLFSPDDYGVQGFRNPDAHGWQEVRRPYAQPRLDDAITHPLAVDDPALRAAGEDELLRLFREQAASFRPQVSDDGRLVDVFGPGDRTGDFFRTFWEQGGGREAWLAPDGQKVAILHGSSNYGGYAVSFDHAGRGVRVGPETLARWLRPYLDSGGAPAQLRLAACKAGMLDGGLTCRLADQVEADVDRVLADLPPAVRQQLAEDVGRALAGVLEQDARAVTTRQNPVVSWDWSKPLHEEQRRLFRDQHLRSIHELASQPWMLRLKPEVAERLAALPPAEREALLARAAEADARLDALRAADRWDSTPQTVAALNDAVRGRFGASAEEAIARVVGERLGPIGDQRLIDQVSQDLSRVVARWQTDGIDAGSADRLRAAVDQVVAGYAPRLGPERSAAVTQAIGDGIAAGIEAAWHGTLAQGVADELGLPVLAPRQSVWFSKDGAYSVDGFTDAEAAGWRWFLPRP